MMADRVFKRPLYVSSTNGYGQLNGSGISQADGLVVAVTIGDVPDLHPELGAAFIVKAVNAHDKILDALREAKVQVEILQERLGIKDTGAGTLSIINTALASVEPHGTEGVGA